MASAIIKDSNKHVTCWVKLWVFHGALQGCFTFKIMIYMQNLNPMTKFLTH